MPPDDQAAQREKQRSEQCQAIFEARQAARSRSGKHGATLRISGGEPEAMVQRLKRGRGFAASYTPSVLANEDRIVTALDMDASSETKVIAPMQRNIVHTSARYLWRRALRGFFFACELHEINTGAAH